MLLGGGITLLIILVLWFPMVFFAYSSALGNSNRPTEFTLRMQFVGYEPIYTMHMDGDFMKPLSQSDWEHMQRIYEKSPFALNFLDEFDRQDVVVVKMRTDSSTTWNLSPPNINSLLWELKNGTVDSKITLSYEVIQPHYGETRRLVDKVERWLDQETCENFANSLESKVEEVVKVRAIFPKMFYIRNNGVVEMLSNDLIDNRKLDYSKFFNLLINKFSDATYDDVYGDLFLKLSSQNEQKWWRLREDCEHSAYEQYPTHDCENFLNIYIFNEKTFPNLLSGFALKG